MKDKIKKISEYILVFTILICTYILLLILADCIPSKLLEKNIKRSIRNFSRRRRNSKI